MTNKLYPSWRNNDTINHIKRDEDGSFQLGNGYYPSLDLSVLSIESPTTNLLVKVYPNPTKELIFITHPISNSFKVFISDLTGKVLFQKQVGKQEPINIESYPTGTYLINVTTEDKKTNSYKIIKQWKTIYPL